MAQEKQPQRKKIEATGQMMKIMSDYFYDLNDAAKSTERKVAWCTSVGPAELLRAMGFAVHFPCCYFHFFTKSHCQNCNLQLFLKFGILTEIGIIIGF